jgi:uncharacterized protein (DUF2235 family)
LWSVWAIRQRAFLLRKNVACSDTFGYKSDSYGAERCNRQKDNTFSDGTGNSAAKVWRTNVWRTFEALDLSGNDQVAFYDDGVGTSSFKLMAILGGAFGFGLRRNVIALYKFACRNYHDPDDELFGFGFSRGAFTIRIVMGLIESQGLVKADNEAELHSLASAAYRAYRRDRYQKLRFEAPYQWLRNKFGPHYPPNEVRKNVKVRFVGVWDTVAAYGMPIYEMTAGIHKYLWPIELPDNHLAKSIMRACQALALDEERTTFHPQLWNETTGNAVNGNAEAAEPARGRFIKDERLSQVWFRACIPMSAAVIRRCAGLHPFV